MGSKRDNNQPTTKVDTLPDGSSLTSTYEGGHLSGRVMRDKSGMVLQDLTFYPDGKVRSMEIYGKPFRHPAAVGKADATLGEIRRDRLSADFAPDGGCYYCNRVRNGRYELWFRDMETRLWDYYRRDVRGDIVGNAHIIYQPTGEATKASIRQHFMSDGYDHEYLFVGHRDGGFEETTRGMTTQYDASEAFVPYFVEQGYDRIMDYPTIRGVERDGASYAATTLRNGDTLDFACLTPGARLGRQTGYVLTSIINGIMQPAKRLTREECVLWEGDRMGMRELVERKLPPAMRSTEQTVKRGRALGM